MDKNIDDLETIFDNAAEENTAVTTEKIVRYFLRGIF